MFASLASALARIHLYYTLFERVFTLTDTTHTVQTNTNELNLENRSLFLQF